MPYPYKKIPGECVPSVTKVVTFVTGAIKLPKMVSCISDSSAEFVWVTSGYIDDNWVCDGTQVVMMVVIQVLSLYGSPVVASMTIGFVMVPTLL